MIKLGINIDHIATLRNARNGFYPSVLDSLNIVKQSADFVTIHLRQDRRHIKDDDAKTICSNENKLPVNFELGMEDEIIKICLELKPNAICIVPEKREEITTESGLNLHNPSVFDNLTKYIPIFLKEQIFTSIFIDPNIENISKIQELCLFSNILNNINKKETNNDLFSKPDAIEIHLGVLSDLIENFIKKHHSNYFEFYNILNIKSFLHFCKYFAKLKTRYSPLLKNQKFTLKQIIFASNIDFFAKKYFNQIVSTKQKSPVKENVLL